MELSINSWHSKLYNIFYTKGLPQSLCPYFWKLVLSIVLFVPFTLWFLPLSIINFIISKNNSSYPQYFDKINLNLSVSLNGIIILLFDLIHALLHKYFLGILLLILMVIVVFTVLVCLKKLFKKKQKKEKVIKIKRPTILQEFIKAKYNKYCPKINWQ